jgi:hypothetical protein
MEVHVEILFNRKYAQESEFSRGFAGAIFTLLPERDYSVQNGHRLRNGDSWFAKSESPIKFRQSLLDVAV